MDGNPVVPAERPKTRREMRKKLEQIVLTEEDERILDDVWARLRRELEQKRRREKGRKR